jgi:hypothetical protein
MGEADTEAAAAGAPAYLRARLPGEVLDLVHAGNVAPVIAGR